MIFGNIRQSGAAAGRDPVVTHTLLLLDTLASPLGGNMQIVCVGDEEITWELALDWLYAAASIRSVKAAADPLGHSFMCENAWEFEKARADLLEPFMCELARFNFIWGAAESVWKMISPPKADTFAPMGNCRPWLTKGGRDRYLPRGYLRALADLGELVSATPWLRKFAHEFRLSREVGMPGLGLHVVIKLRNALAHGTAALPTPDDWGENVVPGPDPYLAAVKLSSRVLLFSMQMMLAFGALQGVFVPTRDPEEWGEREIYDLLHLDLLDRQPGCLVRIMEMPLGTKRRRRFDQRTAPLNSAS